MNKENTNKLRTRFPCLYGTEISFQVGDGWYDILYELSIELEKVYLSAHESELDKKEYLATTVKSKFGFFRFYTNYCSKHKIIDAIIEDTANKLLYICEKCGDSGNHYRLKNGTEGIGCKKCLKKHSYTGQI